MNESKRYCWMLRLRNEGFKHEPRFHQTLQIDINSRTVPKSWGHSKHGGFISVGHQWCVRYKEQIKNVRLVSIGLYITCSLYSAWCVAVVKKIMTACLGLRHNSQAHGDTVNVSSFKVIKHFPTFLALSSILQWKKNTFWSRPCPESVNPLKLKHIMP